MGEVIAASRDATDAFGGNRRGENRQPEITSKTANSQASMSLEGLQAVDPKKKSETVDCPAVADASSTVGTDLVRGPLIRE